ncbi:hypothetical protein [uncultured Paraglaciecola sp.]|uniref:hypothetical protein n=1 Tax=uncultured Paraglaciecola sp. TaxID=1765024 RepID=UPI002619A0F2|nr:hypothetical protein [uncultured Paraglaciecola sp.]
MISDYEKHTFMNYWSRGLWDLRPEMNCKPLDITKYAERIFDCAFNQKNVAISLDDLIDEMKPLFNGRPKFIRLNRRSPKDSLDGGYVKTPEQAIDVLTSSIRSMDDISYLLNYQEQIVLYSFDYWNIACDKEIRCFVKNNKLIGISQYEPSRYKTWPEEDVEALTHSLSELSIKIMENTPLESFIFDVFVFEGNPYFLEINPWGLSDPCYFITYEAVEAGGFAYQKTVIEPLAKDRAEK